MMLVSVITREYVCIERRTKNKTEDFFSVEKMFSVFFQLASVRV